MTDLPILPAATDYKAKAFEGVSLSLHQLFMSNLGDGEPVVTGRTFKRCRIEGPGVLLSLGGNSFDDTNFGYCGGDARRLVLRSGSPDGVIGAVPVQGCAFDHCEFFAVGFTGPESFLQQLIELSTSQQGQT